MALTSAEKVRRFRERQKEEEKQALRRSEATQHWYLKRGFSEYADQSGERIDYEMALDIAGIQADGFYDESNPTSASGEIEPSTYDNIKGSIGRAELTIGMLLEAVTTLAGMVNDFKLQEINARIAELEAADLADPDARKRALADIVRVTKYRDQLSKQVRWTLPQWKVNGE
ncbi:hypothetical protein B5K11_10505 [Rhizobium leguminosarum bv. trifolii]|uniref:hypothetical protein n=1 Tax=Rhizobium leguminosarum TaxID=384 RepID=UPI000E2F5119|nr:hypothetical protein [Rhizobium leguminosarum]RFB95356.1 hypothetical protein B5K11_10505 [Rhizobium leguminosarum bv. trifolii]